jgi:hypothetical protein
MIWFRADLFPGSAWEYQLEAPASLNRVAGATQAPFPGRAWERERWMIWFRANGDTIASATPSDRSVHNSTAPSSDIANAIVPH